MTEQKKQDQNTGRHRRVIPLIQGVAFRGQLRASEVAAELLRTNRGLVETLTKPTAKGDRQCKT